MVCTYSHQVSRVRCYSGSSYVCVGFQLRDFHPLWPAFPYRSSILFSTMSESEPRKDKSLRFRLFPFRSPLLRESHSLSFPLLTEMFHFSRCCSLTLFIHVKVLMFYHQWVSPFGYPRVKACLRLSEAFRSLPRPSSPCVVKASSCCPLLLD